MSTSHKTAEPGDRDNLWERREIGRLTWWFVGLGALLRVGRFAMNYPLWWDEAFVAVNLLRRGYGGLLRPLDYGQVCPLLFLWVEKAAVLALGFSEASLRLFPLLCGLASVFLFRRAAGLVRPGVPQLVATAIFAVSFYPIRHAADVKPYESDLLASLVLLTLALEWLRRPDRSAWLWALTAAGPVAVALSHPVSAFVAGGVGLRLTVPVWRSKKACPRFALTIYGLSTCISFTALFLAFTKAQAGAMMTVMSAEWADSFPPRTGPVALIRWLFESHTGNLFAYPFGASRAASTLTFALFTIGAAALGRRGRWAALSVCLMPFALGTSAAALRRYPYGGSAHGGSTRFMLYLAPSICLLAGLGASAALDRLTDPRRRVRLLRFTLVGLVAAGTIPLLADLPHAYRSTQSQQSRQFARTFWPTLARDAEVACLRWDFNVGSWDSVHLNRPVALCNQAIYSPARRRAQTIRWEAVTSDHPLRCVFPDARPEEEAAVRSWLASMADRFDLRRSETIDLDTAAPGARPSIERYLVFEFVPRPPGPIASPAVTEAHRSGTVGVETGLR